MKTSLKNPLIFFVSSLILFLLCTPLRAWSLYGAAVIESICYILLSFYLFSHYSNSRTTNFIYCVLYIILGRIIVEVPLRIFHFQETVITLYVTSSVILSVIGSALYCKVRSIFKRILIITCWILMVSLGNSSWFHWVNYGFIPDELNVATLRMNESKEISVQMKDINRKYVLLDFWNSSCGICIQQFPDLQELYEKYKDNPDIMISSVFITYRDETYDKGKDILNNRGYTFPMYSLSGSDTWLEQLGVKFFPTVVIIENGKSIIFKGELSKAKNMLQRIKNLTPISNKGIN